MSSRRPGTRVPLAPPKAENGSDQQRNAVVLGPRDRLVGRLYVEGDLRVVGTVDGALEATGDVEIDGGGKVKGPVTTHQRLVVGSEGSLEGDVRVARLVIAEGAIFSGNVSMGKPAMARPEPEAPEPALNPAPDSAESKKKRR